jgi:hypothetical protein
MSKPLQEEYYPLPVPGNDEMARFLEEELERIRNALYAQPVAFTISETANLDVTTVPNWQRLFQISPPSWEVPGGEWNTLLAQWTCPQNGLYQHTVDFRVEPYGSGNKQYFAGIRLYRVPADGGATEVIEAVDSGQDDFPLGVTLPVQAPAYAGDIFYVEGTVVHETFVGVAPTEASWQLNRVSA